MRVNSLLFVPLSTSWRTITTRSLSWATSTFCSLSIVTSFRAKKRPYRNAHREREGKGQNCYRNENDCAHVDFWAARLLLAIAQFGPPVPVRDRNRCGRECHPHC